LCVISQPSTPTEMGKIMAEDNTAISLTTFSTCAHSSVNPTVFLLKKLQKQNNFTDLNINSLALQ